VHNNIAVDFKVNVTFLILTELDVVFTGAQKVLGAMIGITPVALSEAAW